jgi:murein DD-endopeptidase MepM/ murein hydrolase activator NlpD
MLFWFTVAGSILWQEKKLPQLQEQLAIYEKMEAECSKKEVQTLFAEMKCFPVCEDERGKETYYFENGYGAARTYGGDRKHEGIDIMASNNQPGYFAVQSVSDGVVEQMGWLPLGGYRIGIRSQSGFYYYYAHLDSYAAAMKVGKKVSPGEVLGRMGNTGYGKEGTKGKFAVHLHFGIYRKLQNEEKSLNPYYILRYLSKDREESLTKRDWRVPYGNTALERNISALSACSR